jgi:hypothetical protein
LLDGSTRGLTTLNNVYPFGKFVPGLGTDLGFDLVCDQVSTRRGCGRGFAALSICVSGNYPVGVLCTDTTLVEIFAARNQKNGIPVIQTNAWGMGYSALVLLGNYIVLTKSKR